MVVDGRGGGGEGGPYTYSMRVFIAGSRGGGAVYSCASPTLLAELPSGEASLPSLWCGSIIQNHIF